MALKTGIVWFRRDLRLEDHPALFLALQECERVACVYIDTGANDEYTAARAWLRRSLGALGDAIAERGGRLHVLAGDPLSLLPRLADALGCAAVYASRLHEPQADADDARLAALLRRDGRVLRRLGGRVLTDSDALLTRSGTPFRVFTPFLRAAREHWRARRLPAPARIPALALPPVTEFAPQVIAAPVPAWDAGFWADGWTPGEHGARQRLTAFLARIDGYAQARDHPALDASSRLSPHLAFGEVGPDAVFAAASALDSVGAGKFVAELAWREFAYYVLAHWPHTPQANFNARFDGLPWQRNPAHLRAWHAGRTGVPIVDAGMRQLRQTGWMHNRVRMIVASFLCKHLGIDWRRGADWFRRTLIDADLASNTLGWQWVAGTGVDAAPYYRIFNPVLQSRKFDTEGTYIRRWLPELAGLPPADIHAPWERGHRLRDYPAQPLIDMGHGRARALAAFAAMRAS